MRRDGQSPRPILSISLLAIPPPRSFRYLRSGELLLDLLVLLFWREPRRRAPAAVETSLTGRRRRASVPFARSAARRRVPRRRSALRAFFSVLFPSRTLVGQESTSPEERRRAASPLCMGGTQADWIVDAELDRVCRRPHARSARRSTIWSPWRNRVAVAAEDRVLSAELVVTTTCLSSSHRARESPRQLADRGATRGRRLVGKTCVSWISTRRRNRDHIWPLDETVAVAVDHPQDRSDDAAGDAAPIEKRG